MSDQNLTGPAAMAPATVYRPASRGADGALAACRHLVTELWTFRSHIAVVYERDLRQTYRGSPLAIFWQFALPLVPVLVYTLLAVNKVLPAGASIPPPLYVALGVTLWLLFLGCIQNPINVVRTRNSEAMKTALPLSVAVAAGFARLLIETAIRLGLCVLLMGVYKMIPSPVSLLAVPLVLTAGIGFIGLGLMLAILNVPFPDIDRVTSVFLPYGIFLSGAIFPLADRGWLGAMQLANPFAVFIDAIRSLLCHGAFMHPESLAVCFVLALFFALLGCRYFYVMEYRIRGIA